MDAFDVNAAAIAFVDSNEFVEEQPETSENNDATNIFVAQPGSAGIDPVGTQIVLEGNVSNERTTASSMNNRTTRPLQELPHRNQITASHQANANVCSSNVTVRAFEYAKEYQKRREQRLKKQEIEDREKRKYIAKPMPNFAITNKKQPPASSLVSPKTPKVLKRGLAVKEKLKQKMEEHKQSLAERPPIVARGADVLHVEPYKPKLEHHCTSIKPFDLKMTEYLIGRRRRDEERERQRILQQEKERKEKEDKEEKMRKLYRQQTVFKARPNPFKK